MWLWCKMMNRRRHTNRQRIAQLSEDCILLSSDSESELPDPTFDLTNESDEVVDLTAVSDLSVIVIDSPSSSQTRQRNQRRRRARSSSSSRSRQTSRQTSRPMSALIDDTENSSIHGNQRLSDQSADSEHLSNVENFQQPSSEQSASTLTRDGSSIDNQLCPLCLETYKEIKAKGRTLVSTTCGHVFCKTCAYQCLNSTCPTCRKRLTAKSIHPLYL